MRWLAVLSLFPAPLFAQAVVATQVIPARSVVGADQVAVVEAAIDGALTDPVQAVGQEARVTIYPGRPVRAADLGAPALVERNAVVVLLYRAAGLSIATEGRALDRAAEGEPVRVMNLASRSIVTGRVGADGAVLVQP
jgi:flagella basal body P-ring formation protein FlgA